MKPTNVLSFQIADRKLGSLDGYVGSSQTPRRFFDILIDGNSLYALKAEAYDFITNAWNGEKYKAASEQYLQRLLLTEPADFADDRRSLYVCSECGDLGCGAISAVIRREEDEWVWESFGYQNNYDGQVLFEDFESFGPFRFKAAEYEAALANVLQQVRNSQRVP